MTDIDPKLQGISQRLEELVNEKSDGNLKEFASKTGIKYTSIHTNIKKGMLPGADTLYKIHITFNVSTDWLLTGNGPKYVNEIKEELPKKPTDIDKNTLNAIKNYLISHLKKITHEFAEEDLSILLIVLEKWEELPKKNKYEISNLFIQFLLKIQEKCPYNKNPPS